MLRPVACIYAFLAGSLLTVTSGCYHMYSQPYGYSGAPVGTTYPGTMQYGTPIQTLTPGQPYTPGTNYQVSPQGTPTYQSPGGGLQPIPDNAPPYGSPGASNPNPNPNPSTPDPYFPNTYNAPSSGMNGVQPTAFAQPAPAALAPPAAGLREVRSAPIDFVPEVKTTAAPELAPLARMEAIPTASPQLAPVDEIPPAEAFARPVMAPPPARSSDPFTAIPATAAPGPASLPPMEATPASAQTLWDVETKKVVTADVSPFGQDPKYQWLRGIVSKDPEASTWSIIYDDQPDPEDRWAGHLSLAPSNSLNNLKDGDAVEVRGQLDHVVQDRTGKPVYVITSLTRQTRIAP